MIDLGVLLNRTLDIKLPSGNIISCGVPTEGDYIKIINLENEINKKLIDNNSTIEEISQMKDKELKLIFKDVSKEAKSELLGLNTRIKTYVTQEFINFIAQIDKDPN